MSENQDMLHAGCVGDQARDAGCIQPPGVAGQASDQPPAADDGAGRAATAAEVRNSDQAEPPQTLRSFERALRALGFTRLQAQSIARHGFGAAFSAERAEPPPDDDTELLSALQALNQSLKGIP
jgi:hypothetical protein